MFGWFRSPRCPVEPRTKRWIEARMGWLVGQFGWKALSDCPVILPTEEYFPEPFDGSEDSARALFVRTCRYMGLDPARFELVFYRPPRAGKYSLNPRERKEGWTGIWEHGPARPTIWIESLNLENLELVVATLARELAYFRLFGEERADRWDMDCELLAGLTTVHFGLGVLTANAAFRLHSQISRSAALRADSFSSLTPSMWSYALALFAWLRKEEDPSWISLLDSSVRSECRAALVYLHATGDATVVAGESWDKCGSFSTLTEEIAPSDSESAEEEQRDETESLEDGAEIADDYDGDYEDACDEDEPASDADPALEADPFSDPFTQGVLFMQEGKWDEAVHAFTEVLSRSPDDGECCQQRSLAYLELGRSREAMADAEKAVQLDPEDPEAYLVRGIVFSHNQQSTRAIEDLSRYLDEEAGRNAPGASLSKAYYFRGLAHAAQRDLREAVADYTSAISRWPHWPEPYEARADVYERLGSAEKALADREEAARRTKM